MRHAVHDEERGKRSEEGMLLFSGIETTMRRSWSTGHSLSLLQTVDAVAVESWLTLLLCCCPLQTSALPVWHQEDVRHHQGR